MYNLTIFLQGIYYITAYIMFSPKLQKPLLSFRLNFTVSSGHVGQRRRLVPAAFGTKVTVAMTCLEPNSCINYENIHKNNCIVCRRSEDALVRHIQMITSIRIKMLSSVIVVLHCKYFSTSCIELSLISVSYIILSSRTLQKNYLCIQLQFSVFWCH